MRVNSVVNFVCQKNHDSGTESDAPAAYPTQGPSWGYFKVNFSETMSIFGDKCPHNGSKNDTMVPRTTRPHAGPRVDAPIFKNSRLAEMWSSSEEGSHSRLLNCCIAQLQAREQYRRRRRYHTRSTTCVNGHAFGIQGYLAYKTTSPPPPGPPWDHRHRSTVGS